MLSPQLALDQYLVPASQALEIYNLPHLQIGFGTAGQESGFRSIAQQGDGPALGIWQMEPETHDSLWANFIKYRPSIRQALSTCLGGVIIPPPADRLLSDPIYAAMMMFVRYLDAPGAIPADLAGQAAYYVRFYNAGGKATTAEYLNNWKRFSPGISWPTDTD